LSRKKDSISRKHGKKTRKARGNFSFSCKEGRGEDQLFHGEKRKKKEKYIERLHQLALRRGVYLPFSGRATPEVLPQ